MQLVKIKDSKVLIDNKPFFDKPVKTKQTNKKKQEAYEKLIEMSRDNDYLTESLLNYLHHHKFIIIDLQRQKSTSIPQ